MDKDWERQIQRKSEMILRAMSHPMMAQATQALFSTAKEYDELGYRLDEENACPICGAWVYPKQREKHALWHKNQGDGDLTVRIGD